MESIARVIALVSAQYRTKNIDNAKSPALNVKNASAMSLWGFRAMSKLLAYTLLAFALLVVLAIIIYPLFKIIGLPEFISHSVLIAFMGILSLAFGVD